MIVKNIINKNMNSVNISRVEDFMYLYKNKIKFLFIVTMLVGSGALLHGMERGSGSLDGQNHGKGKRKRSDANGLAILATVASDQQDGVGAANYLARQDEASPKDLGVLAAKRACIDG